MKALTPLPLVTALMIHSNSMLAEILTENMLNVTAVPSYVSLFSLQLFELFKLQNVRKRPFVLFEPTCLQCCNGHPPPPAFFFHTKAGHICDDFAETETVFATEDVILTGIAESDLLCTSNGWLFTMSLLESSPLAVTLLLLFSGKFSCRSIKVLLNPF